MDYITLNRFISGPLIRAGYVLGAVLLTVAVGLLWGGSLWSNPTARPFMENAIIFSIMWGMYWMVGQVSWRIVCEGAYLVFKTQGDLAAIREILERRG